jgi:predicted MFS family arabinose efflux permease
MMPRHQPSGGIGYGRILMSMTGMLLSMPALRWRAAFQALMFGAFNMFWTVAPLMLAKRFGLGEHGIGLFALAGAGGALAAPIAGRLADRGLGQVATAAAMIVLGLSFYATGWAVMAGALIALVLLSVIIDAMVQINQVVSQRIIFSVPPQIRGRVNAIYMTITFIGGAIGSVLGTVLYDRGGWAAIAVAGVVIGAVALLLFVVQARGGLSRPR